MRPSLPIDEVLGPLLAHLEAPGQNAVLIAPPGAGKTTCLPPALLDLLAKNEEVIVAQPRRIAARMASQIVARWRGQSVGEEVGYRVRFDAKTSARTRLTYVTEGLLLRRLRDDPRLEGVGALIFDEIHERHLAGDVALALARRTQKSSRPDLRLVAMSATLDPGPLGDFLEAPTFRSEGRAYPVQIEQLSIRDRPLEAQVLRALSQVVDAAPTVDVDGLGHVLVFLPGASEIRRCTRKLAAFCDHHQLELRALHASLPLAQQELAIGPSARPKVILSTNVAETSLTIDQVAVVIDSGLARVSRHDPGAGLPRLELQPISRASAIQRAGRAGRTRPGHCIRLYSRADFDHRPERDRPELLRTDLCDAVFDLALAGVPDPSKFPWFEAPDPGELERALALLRAVGALSQGVAGTASGACQDKQIVTELGRRMAPLPLHPRLACALIHALDAGVGGLACGAVALLAERELRRPDTKADHHDLADPLYELDRIHKARDNPDALRRAGIDARAATGVHRVRRALETKLKVKPGKDRLRGEAAHQALGRAFLAAFSDRVGRVRQRGETLELLGTDGRATPLSPSCVVRESTFAIALRAESRQQNFGPQAGRAQELVTAAYGVEEEDIVECCIEQIEESCVVSFDSQQKRVRAHAQLRLGQLVLSEQALTELPADAYVRLFEEASRAGIEQFVDAEALSALRNRVRFVHERLAPSVPLLDDESLVACLRELCVGKSSFSEIKGGDLLALVRAKFASELTLVNRLAPTSVSLPSGRKLRIDYTPGSPPSVASYLQDFFGSKRGPSIAEGRIALTLHLRAPNRRDVQVTTDLEGFWERHYPALAKQLKRRYPRHPWPDDPVAAQAPKPRPPRGPRAGKGKGKKR